MSTVLTRADNVQPETMHDRVNMTSRNESLNFRILTPSVVRYNALTNGVSSGFGKTLRNLGSIMKVLVKVFVFQMVVAASLGCVSSEEPVRAFTELDTAEDLTCHKWFLDEKSLGIYDLFPTGQKPHSLVAKLRRRDNTVEFHHRFLQGGGFDEERTVKLFLNKDSVILGFYSDTSLGDLLVVVNPENENRLEFRSLPANKIVFEEKMGRGEIFDFKLHKSKEGFWFTYRQDDEEAKGYVAYYKREGTGKKLGFKRIPIKNFNPNLSSDLIFEFEGNLYVFSKKSKGEKIELTYREIQPSGKVGPSLDLGLPVKSSVDSWSAISRDGKLYVAVVDGDSFLRQSNLKVGQLTVSNGVIKPEWFKSRSLMDINVSQPIFQNGGSKLSVLVPKWLDDKSTLARYVIENGGISGVGHVGEFPKATRITDSYFINSEKKSYFIVRMKGGVAWQFSVCELES